MRSPDPWLAIPLSFAAGILLTVFPLPPVLAWWRPEWLLLLLVFWVRHQPSYVGIWTGFLLGLVMDVVLGAHFGVHAAEYAVIAWLTFALSRRFRSGPLSHGLLLVACMVMTALLIRFLLEMILGDRPVSSFYWLPVVSSTLCWPLMTATLQRWEKT
jgi:rod shape-determining protein MreD